ncbi:MAG: segregation/condensation protein A [Candidatus Schekmanbacteria bacterium]|nr:segregation/condensation protein A [Candidatus Schekmanbacteria bacterium]
MPQQTMEKQNTESTESSQESYKVRLPAFEGPLDLLLHLIKKHEIDIYDIPIAVITEQYLMYLDMLRSFDLDIAGEFLVMAATLTYIKSRTLLPILSIEEEEAGDPRQMLVNQLLEYQKYKKTAQELSRLEQERQLVWLHPFTPPEWLGEKPVVDMSKIGIYSLWRAFQRALDNMPKNTPYQIKQRNLTLDGEIAYILAKLKQQPRFTLENLFKSFSLRLEMVLLFIALLELARRQLLTIYQELPCGAIWITVPAIIPLNNPTPA